MVERAGVDPREKFIALLREHARAFFAKEMTPNQEKWAQQKFVDRETWKRTGEAGLICLDVPEEYGGLGMGAVAAAKGNGQAPSAGAPKRPRATGTLATDGPYDLLLAGIDGDPAEPRRAGLLVNNVYGMLRATERGLGIASLPDYLGSTSRHLVRVLPELEGPSFDFYFVYPEELRASKRVSVFRDFLLRKMAEHDVW